MSSRPIGVFDSGVGGLTVLKAILERAPGESTVYLGDTARVPYGTKSPEVVTRYALACARVLLEHDIKLLVVACNTVSAVALPALQSALPVPVLGVVEPGARAAAARSRTGSVAVIGTPSTVASGAYQRALLAARPGLDVRARACPLFVPLAEEGWTEGEVPSLAARRYLDGFLDAQVDTLVLGCTHYPLLGETLARVAGPRVTLVDSAQATAQVVGALLEERALLAPPGEATHRYLVTDTPASFLAVATRFLGRPVAEAGQVDLQGGIR